MMEKASDDSARERAKTVEDERLSAEEMLSEITGEVKAAEVVLRNRKQILDSVVEGDNYAAIADGAQQVADAAKRMEAANEAKEKIHIAVIRTKTQGNVEQQLRGDAMGLAHERAHLADWSRQIVDAYQRFRSTYPDKKVMP